MKDQRSRQKVLGVFGTICLVGTVCLYILGMVLGSNAVFGCGILCAIIGIVLGRKTDKSHVFVLCIILAIVIALELFMRVRDGYTGNGWYYYHLLQHPRDNAWYK